MNDYMVQVAAIAKAVPGVPIQLIWSREDDIRRDYFRPGGWHSFEAGIGANAEVVAFSDRFVTFGDGTTPARAAGFNVTMPPAGLIQHLRYTQSMLPTVVTTGALRAPGSNALCFASQSFLDEVALAAGTDLPKLMLSLLGERREIAAPDNRSPSFDTGRARDVIEKVVQTSSWTQRPTERGRAKGFAFYFSHRGYFAEVVEASVSRGDVTVHKVWVAGDVGSQIVNPMGAENQVRGAVIDGLAQALTGQAIEFIDGAVQQSNFDDFPLARIPMTPEIEIAWVKSDKPPTGLGEPALPPVIPALTNAIFAASDTRIRSLPVRFRGRRDVDLSELGARQARGTAQRIAQQWRPLIVYTSPLRRCVQTAEAIAAACGISAAIRDDLTDLHYGDWEWRTHEEVRAQWPDLFACWFSAPHLVRFPNGESLQDLLARVSNVLRLVRELHREQTVVVVGHSSGNRARSEERRVGKECRSRWSPYH